MTPKMDTIFHEVQVKQEGADSSIMVNQLQGLRVDNRFSRAPYGSGVLVTPRFGIFSCISVYCNHRVAMCNLPDVITRQVLLEDSIDWATVGLKCRLGLGSVGVLVCQNKQDVDLIICIAACL